MKQLKILLIFILGLILGFYLTMLKATPSDKTFAPTDQRSAVSTTPSPQIDIPKKQLCSNSSINEEAVVAKDTSKLSEQSCDHLVLAQQTNWIERSKSLESDHQALIKKYEKSVRKIKKLEQKLSLQYQSDITDEQLENIVPEQIYPIVTSYTGKVREEIHNFHQDEEDIAWGFNINQLFTDFIATHELESSVKLISIICKISRCEILVQLERFDVWTELVTDLAEQPWWGFQSSTMKSKSLDDDSYLYYIYLSGYRGDIN